MIRVLDFLWIRPDLCPQPCVKKKFNDFAYSILCYVKFQETSTKITVSSISDISSYNLERVITIRGSIPDISRAEAEVSRYCAEMFDLQMMFWIWFFFVAEAGAKLSTLTLQPLITLLRLMTKII